MLSCMQKVRLRLTSTHTMRPPKPLYAARAVCSAAAGILLFFQRRSRDGKFHSCTEKLSGDRSIDSSNIQQTDVVFFSPGLLFGVGTSGAIRSRFKGLRVFMTWLQLPQVLYGKEPNMLVMITTLHFLKNELVFFFILFCFVLVVFLVKLRPCAELQEIQSAVPPRVLRDSRISDNSSASLWVICYLYHFV